MTEPLALLCVVVVTIALAFPVAIIVLLDQIVEHQHKRRRQ